MNDQITISCPHCQKRLKVSREHAGKRLRCPNEGCRKPIQLPDASSFATEDPEAQVARPSLRQEHEQPAANERPTGRRSARWWGVGVAVLLVVIGFGVWRGRGTNVGDQGVVTGSSDVQPKNGGDLASPHNDSDGNLAGTPRGPDGERASRSHPEREQQIRTALNLCGKYALDCSSDSRDVVDFAWRMVNPEGTYGGEFPMGELFPRTAEAVARRYPTATFFVRLPFGQEPNPFEQVTSLLGRADAQEAGSLTVPSGTGPYDLPVTWHYYGWCGFGVNREGNVVGLKARCSEFPLQTNQPYDESLEVAPRDLPLPGANGPRFIDLRPRPNQRNTGSSELSIQRIVLAFSPDGPWDESWPQRLPSSTKEIRVRVTLASAPPPGASLYIEVVRSPCEYAYRCDYSAHENHLEATITSTANAFPDGAYRATVSVWQESKGSTHLGLLNWSVGPDRPSGSPSRSD